MLCVKLSNPNSYLFCGHEMRIALVVRGFHLSGGISRYVVELAKYYSINHEVHVYAGHIDTSLLAGVIYHRVPMVSFGYLRRRKLFALNSIFEESTFMLFSYLMIKHKNYDIVHNNGDYIGLSHVYTAHSCHKAWLSLFRKTAPSFIEYLKKSTINPLHMILLFIEKLTYLRSDKIIAISNGVKNEIIQSYHVPESRITVIPHGVNVDEFNIQKNEEIRSRMRRMYQIGSGDVVIIFPAHEFKRKGLSKLIHAVSAMSALNIKILVVGRDDPQPFLSLAEDLQCSGRVIFAGPTSSIADFFNASDMLVFPTTYEPFGLIITEAMASGLPVIVSRCAGAAELITDGVDGLLINDPEDVDKIRSHIQYLYDCVERRIAMGNAARQTVLKYSWTHIAQKTMKVSIGSN